MSNKEEASTFIDTIFEDVNNVILDSCKEAGCVPSKTHKPKNYWCPQLSILRDKKRFWHHLWTSNDRPRSGVVYETWKFAKKNFRRMSRQYMQKQVDRNFNRLNYLYHERKMTSFWNVLKN